MTGDRFGEVELVGQVDRHVGDVVDAVRADAVGQQAGNVPGERTSIGGALIAAGSSPGGRRGVLRLVVPLVVVGISPASAGSSLQAAGGSAIRLAALVQQVEALLDAQEGLVDIALEALQDVHRVLVGARPDAVGVDVRLLDDAAALCLGRLGQAALVDQEGACSWARPTIRSASSWPSR